MFFHALAWAVDQKIDKEEKADKIRIRDDGLPRPRSFCGLTEKQPEL